jgi:hypothetical protein
MEIIPKAKKVRAGITRNLKLKRVPAYCDFKLTD